MSKAEKKTVHTETHTEREREAARERYQQFDLLLSLAHSLCTLVAPSITETAIFHTISVDVVRVRACVCVRVYVHVCD